MKKNFRKTLSIVLCIVMLMSTFVIGITASAVTVNSGTCGDNLTWTLDDEGTLTISGTGEMGNYDADYKYPWYNYKSSISNIFIDSSVTSINRYAFMGCSNLTSVNFAQNSKLSYIGKQAFQRCSNLKNIMIPGGVIIIDDRAFGGCSSLESFSVPDSVINIGEGAFSNCLSLIDITIPSSVQSIGNFVFSNCESLTSMTVDKENTYFDSRNNCNAIIETKTNTLIQGCNKSTIPDGVTSIGYCAFDSCKGITNITIPDSVTSIDDCAFDICSSLESITIPDGVASIGKWTFRGCSSLKSITIPDSVTSIGDEAFNGCKNLLEIKIPDGVTNIGDFAFNECTSFTSVTIPDSVTSIGIYAFSGCTSLASITISDNVTNISDCTFYKCTSLKNVTIPDSVTRIGDWAFGYCTSLTSITIPNSVTSIGNYAFYNCSSLKDVYYSGSEDDRNNIKIGSDNDALLNATWHYNSTGSLLSVKDKATGVEISYNPDCFNQAINLHVEKVDINKVDEKIIGDNEIKGMDIEYLYNIYPEYNSKIVQPNGKVLVRIPTPENADTSKIKIFHYFTGENNQLKKITIKNSEINFKDGYMEFYVSHFSTFAVCTEKATGITNVKLNVAAATAVDYRSKVTIKATATGVPEEYYLAIYVNGKQVAKGSNTEVTYTVGQATSDINYTVKVIDAKGNVQKDATNKDLAKDGGKITVNSSFFAKIIAFFRGLFGLLPTVVIKP